MIIILIFFNQVSVYWNNFRYSLFHFRKFNKRIEKDCLSICSISQLRWRLHSLDITFSRTSSQSNRDLIEAWISKGWYFFIPFLYFFAIRDTNVRWRTCSVSWIRHINCNTNVQIKGLIRAVNQAVVWLTCRKLQRLFGNAAANCIVNYMPKHCGPGRS